MKKFLLFVLVLWGCFEASASYKYLLFTTKDGSTAVISSEGLVIDVNGSELKVSNAVGSELILNSQNLLSMQFTNDDGSNAIHSISFDNEEVSVYTIDGLYSGHYNSINEARLSLPKGVYVVKNEKGDSVKIIVGQ